MAKRRNTITLPAVLDTGSAKLTIRADGTYGRVYTREADGQAFAVRTTDQHHSMSGVLSALPSPLDEALARRRITPEQHRAGEILSEAHALAFGSGCRTADLEPTTRAPGAPRVPTEIIVAAHRWNRATAELSAKAGPIVLDVVITVLIHERPANRAAESLGLSKRDGIELLRFGLDHLAFMFGLVDREPAPRPNDQRRWEAKRARARAVVMPALKAAWARRKGDG